MAIVLQSLIRGIGSQARSIIGPSSNTVYTVNSLGQVAVADLDAAILVAKGEWAPIDPGSGLNYAVVDFGVFPGSNFASTTIPDAAPPSDTVALIACQVVPVATVDHSADEHAVDGPIVSAVPDGNGNILINAIPNNNVPKIDSMMPWGKWSVAWTYLQ